MKKQAIILALIIIFVFVGIYFYTTQFPTVKNVSSTIVPVTSIAPISAPRQVNFTTTSNVAFSFSTPPPTFPASLPTYSVSYSSEVMTSIITLVKKWGFSASLTKPVPYVFDWIEKEKHFSYNDKDKSVSFAFFSQQTSSPSALSLTTQDVFKDLIDVGLLSKTVVFTETNRQVVPAGSGEGMDTTSQAITITSYQSNVVNQQFPFYFNGVERASGDVRTDVNNKIISFAFNLPPSLKKEQDREILSPESILDNLNNKKGYLQAIITSESSYGPEPEASYSQVKISSISIAYLYIKEESRFAPIFIIEGMGYGDKPQRVRYYLRATS
jgi:hypothetical protein